MEHRYYDSAEPKHRARGDQAGGAKWWKTASRQKQQTKESKAEQRKQEDEECKGAPSCHIGEADAGKPNPSQ